MRNLLMVLVALGLGTKRHWHIFIAIFLGVLFGFFLPFDPAHPSFFHQAFELIGQLFIRSVAMLVIPLIISSLIIGIHSLGDGRQLGKIGGKTIFFFILTMSIAATIAAAVGYYVQPGMHIPQNLHLTLGVLPFRPEEHAQIHSIQELILNIVPQNPFESLAKRDLVPIILFVGLFGTAMTLIGDTARPFIGFFEAIYAATMRIVDWLMIFAVLGVFSLTFTAISHGGIQLFQFMLPYMGCLVLCLLIQVLVVYPLLLYFVARVNFLDLYRAISEALLVAFGTASSSATLPVTLACIERRGGVSNRIASFVVPAGVSMNMNGTTIFEVTAVIFLAQMYGLPLNFGSLCIIVLLGIVAAVGAGGVPSTGLITMAIILNGLGGFRPEQVVEGLSLLWSVDRILDMCRTTVNVMDDCVVATLIAAGEGELNREVLTSSGEAWEDVV